MPAGQGLEHPESPVPPLGAVRAGSTTPRAVHGVHLDEHAAGSSCLAGQHRQEGAPPGVGVARLSPVFARSPPAPSGTVGGRFTTLAPEVPPQRSPRSGCHIPAPGEGRPGLMPAGSSSCTRPHGSRRQPRSDRAPGLRPDREAEWGQGAVAGLRQGETGPAPLSEQRGCGRPLLEDRSGCSAHRWTMANRSRDVIEGIARVFSVPDGDHRVRGERAGIGLVGLTLHRPRRPALLRHVTVGRGR